MYIKLKTIYYTIINTKTKFHAYKNKNIINIIIYFNDRHWRTIWKYTKILSSHNELIYSNYSVFTHTALQSQNTVITSILHLIDLLNVQSGFSPLWGS